MPRRAIAAAVAALAAAALVVLPAAAAQADANPFGAYDTAHALWQYQLSSLPPTAADIKRYNPSFTDDQVNQALLNSNEQLDLQQQKILTRKYSYDPNTGDYTLGKTSDYVNSTNADLQAEVAAQKAGYRAPLSKFKAIGKVAGDATTALFGYELGATIGNGIVSFAGVDSAKTVCTSDWAVLGPIAGDGDCSDWLAANPQFKPNTDATANTDWGTTCDEQGVCATITLQIEVPGATVYCATISGGSLQRYEGPRWHYANDPNPGDQTGTSWSNYSDVAFYNRGPGTCTAGQYYVQDAGDFHAAGWDKWTMKQSGTVLDQAVTRGTASPERHLVCTVSGDDGHVYSQSSAAFHEGDATLPEPTCPALPKGVNATHVKLTETGVSPPSVLYDEDEDPYAKELQQKYPQCTDGTCALDLKERANNESCFDGVATCDGWWTDPAKETKYECTYDEQEVTLDHCARYRQTFDEANRKAGAPYSNRDGSYNPNPSTPGDKAKQLASTPSVSNCMKTDDGSDTWSVIFSPVRCALVWAFVPDSVTIQKDGSDAVDKWLASPIGKVVTIPAGWFASVSVPGCKGPALTYLGTTYYPIAACDGDTFAVLAPIVRTFTDVLLYIWGCVAILNLVGGVIGFRGPASNPGEES